MDSTLFSSYLNPDFLNTSEALSEYIILGNSKIVIPYINLHLMPHNPITNRASFVDFSIWIFEGVSLALFDSENSHFSLEFSEFNKNDKVSHLIIGGYKENDLGAEMNVQYQNSVLIIPDSSIIDIKKTKSKSSIIIPKEILNDIGEYQIKLII